MGVRHGRRTSGTGDAGAVGPDEDCVAGTIKQVCLIWQPSRLTRLPNTRVFSDRFILSFCSTVCPTIPFAVQPSATR